MGKTIKRRIVLTRTYRPINEPSLGPNEHKIAEHWKASYEGLDPKDNPRAERQRYLEVVTGINAVREESPLRVEIYFKDIPKTR